MHRTKEGASTSLNLLIATTSMRTLLLTWLTRSRSQLICRFVWIKPSTRLAIKLISSLQRLLQLLMAHLGRDRATPDVQRTVHHAKLQTSLGPTTTLKVIRPYASARIRFGWMEVLPIINDINRMRLQLLVLQVSRRRLRMHGRLSNCPRAKTEPTYPVQLQTPTRLLTNKFSSWTHLNQTTRPSKQRPWITHISTA